MNADLPNSAQIKDFYDRKLREIGGEYIRYRWGASEPQRRHFKQTFAALSSVFSKYRPAGDVLEIGAGPAVWTEIYIGGVTSLTLLDISTEMLNAARDRIQGWDHGRYSKLVTYRCGDAVETDLGESTFDTIVSIRAFEYFSNKPLFLQKCRKMLRNNGTLILGTKNGGWADSLHSRAMAARTKDAPVESAMQNDLLDATSTMEMMRAAKLDVLECRPLVFGSYLKKYTLPGALWYFDRLHKRRAARPIDGTGSHFMESYVIIARKSAA